MPKPGPSKYVPADLLKPLMAHALGYRVVRAYDLHDEGQRDPFYCAIPLDPGPILLRTRYDDVHELIARIIVSLGEGTTPKEVYSQAVAYLLHKGQPPF